MKLASFTMALLWAGCVSSHPGTGTSPAPGATSTKSSSPLVWGRFLALNYQQAGQPKLTDSEVALIRKTLALVKPCQRPWLEYSFDHTDPTGKTIDLYFEPTDPNRDTVQIIWKGGDYWFDDGRPFTHAADNEPIPGVQKPFADYPCHPDT